MPGYLQLLIRVIPRETGACTVTLEFDDPRAEAPVESDPGEANFDFERLQLTLDEPAEYGAVLTESLFADKRVDAAFRDACAVADHDQIPLQVRLLIGADNPDLYSETMKLHALRWETLRDPRDGNSTSLVTAERILFSRYLPSPDWRPVQPRPRSGLRALVVISSPRGLDHYGSRDAPLQPVDVAAELALATEGLGAIPFDALDSGGRATLGNLVDHLRRGYDILYLVCHGAIPRDGYPVLYLEDDTGNVDAVYASKVAEALGKLRVPPTLVVVASCQSAGDGLRGDFAAALAPRLARAGIPAVLGMQGKIRVQASQPFMKRFFTELGRDGQIDRAVAMARGAIEQEPDFWTPVLFTRLRSGRVWAVSSTSDSGFESWPVLISRIREGRCTPILGPGLIEFLLGSSRDIARRWADTYRFPMAPHEREDLPQVAQYLAIHLADLEAPEIELAGYLKQEMHQKYGEQLPDSLHDAGLDALVTEIGRQRRERDETEPHRVLARLPLPIYITTNPDNLLTEALVEAGKDPQKDFVRWKDDIDWPPSVFDTEQGYGPALRRPLVYHLFGQIETRGSLVLTEDDYFDYLIGVTNRQPPVIGRVLTETLLFLGFQMDDWNFRVLFHSLMNQESRERRKKWLNVAVQLDPAEGPSSDPQRARRYLEQYFQEDHITIYWGSAEQFIKELWEKWNRGG